MKGCFSLDYKYNTIQGGHSGMEIINRRGGLGVGDGDSNGEESDSLSRTSCKISNNRYCIRTSFEEDKISKFNNNLSLYILRVLFFKFCHSKCLQSNTKRYFLESIDFNCANILFCK